jgi:hypothetical protein
MIDQLINPGLIDSIIAAITACIVAPISCIIGFWAGTYWCCLTPISSIAFGILFGVEMGKYFAPFITENLRGICPLS